MKRLSSIKPIFILGHGRSGTNYLGDMLSAHPDILGTIEEKIWFDQFSNIAFNPKKNLWKLPYYVALQKTFIQLKTDKPIWLDMTHPFLLLYDEIKKHYSNAYGIHIIRNPYDLYCSAIRHKGVLSWFNRKKEVEKERENIFLGINKENIQKYDEYTVAEKIASRWKSWVEVGLSLEKKYDKFMSIKYEDLIRDPIKNFKLICNFCDINKDETWMSYISDNTYKGSLNRYKKDIIYEDFIDIKMILNDFINRHDILSEYNINL